VVLGGTHRLAALSSAGASLFPRFRRAEGFRGFTGSLALRPVELLLTGVFPSQRRLLPPSFPPGRSPFPRSDITTVAPEIGACRLLHQSFRGLLSVYSRYRLNARRVAYATFYTEGFGSFVTSAAASIATAWNEPVPGRDFSPAEDQCLFTAHPIF
jgi:hypothetical protein